MILGQSEHQEITTVGAPLLTCVAPPTQKMSFRRFFAQIYDWKHLYLCIFLYDIPSLCHNFSYTFDPKMHLPAMNRCSNHGVAKRHQFSCALSTETLSLKFENVIPEGWI